MRDLPLLEKPKMREAMRKAWQRWELSQAVRKISDVQFGAFQKKHRLDRVVCVNLTSTEPNLRLGAAHKSLAAFERALDKDNQKAVRPSALYAYAAGSLGLPFVHFTPSNSALIPAIEELFATNQAPFMGCDGKTGETLVKSALAPMFKYRDLRVLSWQGYNILGDRDGHVLADSDPGEGFESIQPDLEDVYFATIRGGQSQAAAA